VGPVVADCAAERVGLERESERQRRRADVEIVDRGGQATIPRERVRLEVDGQVSRRVKAQPNAGTPGEQVVCQIGQVEQGSTSACRPEEFPATVAQGDHALLGMDVTGVAKRLSLCARR